MDRHALIQRSVTLINEIDFVIGEPNFPHSARATTSAMLANLGRQHHRAIIRLIEADLPASAAALLRVIFECYVRAVWLHECATDEQVANLDRDPWPHFGSMVEAIENVPHLSTGVLRDAKKSRWSTFNGFTHNGSAALARQIKSGNVEPHFSDEEVVDIVQFADSIGLWGGLQMGVLSGDAKIGEALLKLTERYQNS